MTSSTIKTLDTVQLFFEAAIIVAYVVSVIPTLYYSLFWVVMSLLAVNLIFGIIKKDNTQVFTAINLVMSILAFIPILGWVAIFIGIFMSIISVQLLNNRLNVVAKKTYDQQQDNSQQKQTNEADEVEIKTVKVTKKPNPNKI